MSGCQSWSCSHKLPSQTYNNWFTLRWFTMRKNFVWNDLCWSEFIFFMSKFQGLTCWGLKSASVIGTVLVVRQKRWPRLRTVTILQVLGIFCDGKHKKWFCNNSIDWICLEVKRNNVYCNIYSPNRHSSGTAENSFRWFSLHYFFFILDTSNAYISWSSSTHFE